MRQPSTPAVPLLALLAPLVAAPASGQCSGQTEFPAVLTDVDYASPSVRLAGGAWGYQRLYLYRPDADQHPGVRPILLETKTLTPGEDPTQSDHPWLVSKLTGKKDSFSGRFLCGGYAVVRALTGFNRGQDCAAAVPVKGRGLFVPPGSPETDAAYADYERPMAERDAIMAIQYVKDRILSGDPNWRDLDPDRIVLVAQSYVAIAASWAAMGPDRAQQTFPAPPPGQLQSTQERRDTRVWAFICRRGLLWIPGQDASVSPQSHWPQQVPCDPGVGLDLRAGLDDEPIHPPGLEVWASALDYGPAVVPPTPVFLYYEVPNVHPVEPVAPVSLAAGTEPPHSCWDGCAWKATLPATSKLVLTEAAVPYGSEWMTGGWYDETVDPLDPKQETGLAFDWIEELRTKGKPSLVNLGCGVRVDIGADKFLPHFWGAWNGGQFDFELTGAPAGFTAEVWKDDGATQQPIHTFTTALDSTLGSFVDSPTGPVTYHVRVLTSPVQAESNRVRYDP